MRSHGRNNRRNRGNKGQDDEQFLDSRVDESRSESYSRPQQSSHRTESYRPPPISNRASYDVNREASTSRNHRDTDSWRPADAVPDRYQYASNDGYHRGGRDDYDGVDSRNTEEWPVRPTSDTHHSQPRGEWPQRYDPSYSSSTYLESSSWNTPSTTSYNHRKPSYDQWTSRDSTRSHVPDESTPSMGPLEDRPIEVEQSGWLRDQRRDKGGQKFQSDSGWDTRRRSKGWKEPNPQEAPLPHEGGHTGDRSWEPAPTWQPSTRGDPHNQRNNFGQRNSYPNRNAKGGGGKRTQNQNKQRRDWRSDDGSLNNWPKRDNQGSSPEKTKVPIRRKHPRSSSQSRSRSPAESYYSRRSSRGRSRSRSVSPASKRRRRDSSPIAPRSRTPSDRGRAGWLPHRDRQHSPSRSPRRSPGSPQTRHRSVSSASSMSSERSVSASPPGRPRAVHRLPPVGSAVAANSMTKGGVGNVRNPNPTPRRNGKNQANGKHRRGLALVHASSVDIMPPPPTIPHNSRPTSGLREISHTPPPEPRRIEIASPTTNATRLTPVKLAGFKPIGQTSSAVKKFFPGDDDDDMDVSDDQNPSSPPAASSAEETSRRQYVPPSEMMLRDDRLRHEVDTNHKSSPGHRLNNDHDSHTHRLKMDPSPQDHPHHQPLVGTGLPKETGANGAATKLSPPKAILDRESNDGPPGVSTPSISSRGELYNIISQVGEGTFGKVYKAQNTITRVHVALKRIRMESEKDGFPVTAMREIKLLQSLRHENVVRLYEMMVSNGSVYMVFEYMDHDLTGVLSQTQFNFTDAHLKSLCHQMLAGLAYLHHKGVIHRDIKGSNILINNRGELKLADFGLARFYQKRRRADYTNRVITLWYRPPELLFGATIYGPEVDMWSAGCIMLELFTKKPVFQGNDEIHQLDVVYKIIGTPTTERWAGVTELPWYELVKPKEVIPNHFRELFQKWMSPAALDLAERLLAYDPSQRVNAVQAMEAPYFTQEDPPAAPPVGLATLEGEWHELETKRERAKKRRKTETAMQ